MRLTLGVSAASKELSDLMGAQHLNETRKSVTHYLKLHRDTHRTPVIFHMILLSDSKTFARHHLAVHRTTVYHCTM